MAKNSKSDFDCKHGIVAMDFNPSIAWLEYYNKKTVDKDLIIRWILKKHYWCGKFEFLRKFLKYGNIKKTDKILEAGCGTGKISVSIAYEIGCDVTCLDYSDEVLKTVKFIYSIISKKKGELNVSFIKGDLLAIDYDIGKYDIVFNEGVIEHWLNEKDRLNAIENMVKATKSGGKVFIWVPNRENPFYRFWEITKYTGIYDVPEKPFTKEELSAYMKKAGLIDIIITGHQAYLTPFIWPKILNKFRIFGIIFWLIGKFLPTKFTEKMSIKFSHEILGIGTAP